MASRTVALPRLLARSAARASLPARTLLRTPALPARTLATTRALRQPPPAQAAAATPAAATQEAPQWLRDKVSTASLWLRDSCRCEICVSPSSGQKSFATPDIPATIRPSSVRVSPDSSLTVTWENDIPSAATQGHVSVYPQSYLDALHYRKPLAPSEPNDFRVVDRRIPYKPWDRKEIEGQLRRIDYKDWMNSDEAVQQGLLNLEAFGLVFLKNAPGEEGAVAEIGLRIANLQETFYGRTWDVVSKPNAENVAYTNSYLGLHEDMLYIQQPPRIQLLHCLENSCAGGESIFSDGNHAALTMMRDPNEAEAVKLLSEVLVRYHYDKAPFSYRHARPVFNTRTDDAGNTELVNIWWSPPFQAPNPPEGTGAAHEQHRRWLSALQRFESLLSAEENVYEYKMEPGECVLFDNRRVLHGRKAFNTGSGVRWLRGTYVADEDFTSKVRSVSEAAVEAYRREKGLAGRVSALRNADELLAGYGSLGMWLRSPEVELPKEALEGKWKA